MSSAHRLLAKIVVSGAGGHSKVVLALIEAQGHYEIAGVLDDDEAKRGNIVYGYPVIGKRDQLTQHRA